MNKLNSVPILGVGQGELLLEEMDTDVTPGPNGGIQQKLQLTFGVSPAPGVTWNHYYKPNGTLVLIRIAADAGSGSPRRVYAFANFLEIFEQITYLES
jgi:hypothetical protein